MKVGDLVILRGQRKGRFHLEGGYIVHIDGAAAVLYGDQGTWVWPLDDLEPYTKDYGTEKGNEIVKAG